MLRWFRLWRDTRWFMKHWQFNRDTSAYYAGLRERRREQRRMGYR